MHISLKLSRWLGITVVSGVVGYIYARHHSRIEDEWCEKYLITLIPALLKKIDATEDVAHLGAEMEELLAEIPAPLPSKEMRFLEKYTGKKNWLEKMDPACLGRLLLQRMANSGLITMERDSEGASVCLVTDAGKNFLNSL